MKRSQTVALLDGRRDQWNRRNEPRMWPPSTPPGSPVTPDYPLPEHRQCCHALTRRRAQTRHRTESSDHGRWRCRAPGTGVRGQGELDSPAPTDITENTIHNYNGVLYGNVAPVIGAIRVSELKSALVEAMLDAMADQGLAASTMRHALNLTRRVLKFAMRRFRPAASGVSQLVSGRPADIQLVVASHGRLARAGRSARSDVSTDGRIRAPPASHATWPSSANWGPSQAVLLPLSPRHGRETAALCRRWRS